MSHPPTCAGTCLTVAHVVQRCQQRSGARAADACEHADTSSAAPRLDIDDLVAESNMLWQAVLYAAPSYAHLFRQTFLDFQHLR